MAVAAAAMSDSVAAVRMVGSLPDTYAIKELTLALGSPIEA